MIFLLDTDTLIYTIRGLKTTGRNRKHSAIRKRAGCFVDRCKAAQKAGNTLGVSAITISELEYGAHRSGHYQSEIAAVHKVLVPFTAFHFDAVSCSYHYGRIRHELEASGQPIGPMDLLIAANAIALEAILVTNNEEHFRRVSGMQIENWSE